MRIRVRLFARAKDLAGADVLDVEMGAGARVVELRRRILEERPALAPILEQSAWAVDQEFANMATPLREGAEVALLPPVSGGWIPVLG
jgi:molybdopterin converting factor subunit 1